MKKGAPSVPGYDIIRQTGKGGMIAHTLPHRRALYLVLLVAGCDTRDSASLPAAPVSMSSTTPPAPAPAPDALPPPAASAAPPERPDFRVVLEVPPGLKKVREGRLARGRAETYTSSGTAALAVSWGWRSPDDPSLEAEWKSAIEAPPGSTVTFKKKGTTWFATAGTVGEKMFHSRVVIDGERRAQLTLTFAPAERAKFDPWIASLSRSFRIEADGAPPAAIRQP